MSRFRPAGVTANRTERILTITWADGHVSDYPFAGLRAICPCVACKGGHAHMGAPPDPHKVVNTPNSGINLEELQRAGAYALQFQWSDGHATGIYTWQFLRGACPCPRCYTPLTD